MLVNVSESVAKKFPVVCDDARWSERKVMRSAAGHYIGRECYDPEMEMAVPGMRETGYFRKETDAAAVLRDGKINRSHFRVCEENDRMYRLGMPRDIG